MELNIIAIGNSKGIRLSKALLYRYQIKDKIELVLEAGQIILKPVETMPREGWGLAFKEMNEAGDDQLLIDDVFDDEDLEEWS